MLDIRIIPPSVVKIRITEYSASAGILVEF